MRHLLNRRKKFKIQNIYTNFFIEKFKWNIAFNKKNFMKIKLLDYAQKLFWLNFFNVYSEVNSLMFKKINYYKLFNSFFFKTKQKIGLNTILFLARLTRRLTFQN